MLSLKKLDRLFAKYNINPAEDQFLAMLHEAARLKTEVTVPEVEWTPEEMQDALHGKKPLFASRFIHVPREEFLRVFAAIRAVADESIPSGDPCLNIPEPEAFFTQDTLDALAKYPDALWDRIEEAGMGYDQVLNTSPAKVLDFLESRGHAPIESLRSFFTPYP